MNLLRNLLIYSLLPGLFLLSSCQYQEEIDTEYPVIDADFAETFPQQCSILTKGETFTFKARFTDNVQLGSFSIDIHHNFDHHTHSTEVNDCDMEPVKEAENPFLFIQNYPIPEGQREYVAEFEMEIPEDVDSGDYHFMIRLTDEEGWQTIRGISIKIE
ncbi:hypothetical protein OKW21_006100 [Catalinimonas alkaloidigena]|uniref:DUF4625 domain-containing protein n=1 Tax=Catalinimonas alkaloidigena TaxID=1075417 RepID=UPI002405F67B|nr:DUF4625 domain-containing protein [Catalinimonas alkaloidigena]MDF9800837.1 hypothetical protein [Catalinimonas alkaloidigena]